MEILHEQNRAAGKIAVVLLCAALATVSLAASRYTSTPHKPVTLVASSGADLARRVQVASRASRSAAPREVPTTVTTVAPPTTAPPAPAGRAPAVVARPVVRQQSASAPTPKPAPKPAAPTTTRPTPTTRPPAAPKAPPSGGASASSEEGKASYYRAGYHGQDPWICAHKTLPMGTVVTVTALSSGKSLTCHVGDRGPYVEGRIIDLSEQAFSQLAPTSSGVISVRISW